MNRSWRLSIWQSFRQRKNSTLEWILGAAATLMVLVLTVPALRSAFSFGPMAPWEWLAALAAGFSGVAWFEAYKARAPVRTLAR